MKLRGIFFDLDDTLIGYAAAEQEALEAGGRLVTRRYPTVDPQALRRAVHRVYRDRYRHGTPGYADLAKLSVRALRRRLTDAALEILGVRDPSLTDSLVLAYSRAERVALRAFPDALHVLQALRPHFRLGLITNGPSAMQRAKLSRVGLSGFFDPIIVDTEFGCPKPDVRIFEHAARQVGMAPDELLFVGNSLAADIAGACAAGWTSVWMNPDAEPLEEIRPDFQIERLSELLALPPLAQALPARPLASAPARLSRVA